MRFVYKNAEKAWGWVGSHQFALLIGVLAIEVLAVWMLVIFSLVWPQTIPYTYAAQRTCTTSPKVLPGLFVTTTNPAFTLQRTKTVEVGGAVLYSHKVCAYPNQQPTESESMISYESVKNLGFVRKPITVSTAEYPKTAQKFSGKPIPVDKPLQIALTKPDGTFRYSIQANDRTATCQTKTQTLYCDISGLAFEHAKKYPIKLVRAFNSQPAGIVTEQTVETLTPINIVASSIPAGGTVYDKPSQLTLETDKPIADIGTAVLVSKAPDGGETKVPLAINKTGQTLVMTLPELVRKTHYEVRLDGLRATDGSSLPASVYSLPFYASGGPKVVKINVGTVKVAQNSTFVITFDQPIAPGQNLAAIASFAVNGAAQPAVLSVDGNALIVKPVNSLPFCATFTLQLSGGLQNPAGISGDSAWKFNGRAVCMTTFSIGTSVQGRAITAYRFGEGANPIMYVGALHGNELSSKIVLERWVGDLENNPDMVPAGRSIVVIPSMNPDGVASRTRVNANNVDLNRNFPANDWKSAVTLPGGGQTANGGGSAPLSEPESRALANYIQAQRPRAVLSYHAVAGLVEANEAGDSVRMAELYCLATRYRNIPRSHNYFTYDTTGSMEDWMRDKLGLPALVIELSTATGNEYSRNKPAMQAMLKL